jgi:methylmalonyl-CoA mutase cobalamin-binding subunit
MADFGNEGLAELYRRPGAVSTVYADVTQDASDPKRTKTIRHRTVREALAEAGAPEVDAVAVSELLEAPPGVGGPMSRLIIVREGAVEVNEVLAGEPLAELLVSYGPVPNLIPLLIQRPRDLRYVVAEVGRDGGEISLFRFNRPEPVAERDVKGDTEFITKVGSEDDFLAGGRYQHHTEEVWKRNEAQVAQAIDEVVKDSGAELLVVTGDVRARQLLVDQLSPASRKILTELPATTRQEDASQDELDAEVHRNIAASLAADEYNALQRLETGRNDGLSEIDFAAVVRALQQAQVDTLIVTSGGMQMPTLIALDREPWVAVTSDDALGAGELGPVPAADALVRAAILTDAQVVVVSPTELPADASAAVILRWPTVPADQGM